MSIQDGIEITANQYEKKDFLDMERRILNNLKWKTNLPVTGEFARLMVEINGRDEKDKEIFEQIEEYIYLCLTGFKKLMKNSLLGDSLMRLLQRPAYSVTTIQ